MFESRFDVSRETFLKLKTYVDLIIKWNPKINLVSKSTLDNIWDRHIEDSLQVYFQADTPVGTWLDIGSGGGLPGLVVAIMAKESAPDLKVQMIESDQRKSVFLRTVIRELSLNATVETQRIEKALPANANILSARALADLSDLLGFAEAHLNQGGYCLFPKGKSWKNEVKKAEESWRFDYDVFKSVTDADAVVLKVREVERV